MDNTLIDIQNENQFNTDKNSRHSYLPIYQQLFNRFQNSDINLLEIGVLGGESLKLWSKYFSKAEIYGIDIFVRVSFEDVERNLEGFNNILLAGVDSFGEFQKSIDSRNNFLNEINDKMFNIIIDDGHHASTSQIITFNNFIDKLHPSGVYIIEDIRDWDGQLEHIKEQLPDLKIIKLNPLPGLNDNIIGVYSKDESFYEELNYEN